MRIEKEYYTIAVDNRVVILKSFHTWDSRVNRALTADMKKLIEQRFGSRPWALICDVRDWGLNTPDAEDSSSENLMTPDLFFPTHAAFATGGSEIKHWQLEKMLKDNGRFEFGIFHGMDEAVKWLHSKGYTFSVPD